MRLFSCPNYLSNEIMLATRVRKAIKREYFSYLAIGITPEGENRHIDRRKHYSINEPSWKHGGFCLPEKDGENMLSVKEIAKRVRFRLHDAPANTYTDEEILDAINCGLRIVRRAIADIRPSLLMQKKEGILNAGEKTISLAKRPTKIVAVTAGDKVVKTETKYFSAKVWHNRDIVYGNHNPIYTKTVVKTWREFALRETELARIVGRASDATGRVREFFLSGEKDLTFFPAPKVETKYTVLTVDDIEETDFDGTSPLNTEHDDFLIEYAAGRLALGNEYNMAAEMQLVQSVTAQIERLLAPPPTSVATRGYWR